MKKIVKFSYPFDWPILRQTPLGLGKWGDYDFIINDSKLKRCDFWVVFQDLLNEEQVECSKSNTVFIAPEGGKIEYYNAKFLAQFGNVITTQQRINGQGAHHQFTSTPWFVNKTFDELMATLEVIKTKNISLICSDKQLTPGHMKRYDFCMRLKEYFGDAIDLFGRGINGFDDKWDVLAPYKYSLAIENQIEDHYFTEKLYDCYLAHTFPFYYGCNNIGQYFDKKSMLTIDINDFDNSLKTIEAVLEDKEFYSKNLQHLIAAKKLYLNNYNIFPYIINFIETNLTSIEQHETQKIKASRSFAKRGFITRLSNIRHFLIKN